MLIRIAAGALVVVSLAGCGSARNNDTTAIRRAIAHSPKTYFGFRGPVWWGKRVPITITSISARDGFAVARIHVAAGPRIFRTQWALVARRAREWQVVAVSLTYRKYLPCGSAPRDVLHRLAGGCSTQPLYPTGVVTGSRSVRRPTAGERAAIVEAARTAVLHGHDSCVRYGVAISTLDRRYASVSYTFVKPYTNCLVGNGVSIFQRTSTGWKDAGAASDGFPCSHLPPGVVRSLFGGCLIG